MSGSKSKKKLYIGLVVVLVIILALIWYAYYKINSPSYGTITQSTNANTNNSTLNLSPIHVSSNYASYNYPQLMSADKVDSFKYPTLGVFDYSYHDIETWELNIMIMDEPSGSLSTNSAYLFRKLHPDEYSQSNINVDGIPAVVMTDSDAGGFSKLAILVNGQYQATVSLIGDDAGGTASLQTVFSMVLNSWKWNAS